MFPYISAVQRCPSIPRDRMHLLVTIHALHLCLALPPAVPSSRPCPFLVVQLFPTSRPSCLPDIRRTAVSPAFVTVDVSHLHPIAHTLSRSPSIMQRPYHITPPLAQFPRSAGRQPYHTRGSPSASFSRSLHTHTSRLSPCHPAASLPRYRPSSSLHHDVLSRALNVPVMDCPTYRPSYVVFIVYMYNLCILGHDLADCVCRLA